MPAYKLMYFDAKARAELARLIMAEGGQKYEDKRVEYNDWATIKPTTPFGSMPILYIDDLPLCQSGAINRYLASELNIAGETPQQKAFADMLVTTLDEVCFKLPFMESDEAERKKKVKELCEKSACAVFEKVENKLKTKNTDYIFGNFTYADLALFHVLETFCAFDSCFGDKYPTLKALAKRVSERPNIKKWIATRPQNKF